MITYSQNFEDVILARVFQRRERGFYVDVGAGDPDHMSVTKWFYDQGWSGINLEPNRDLFKRLVANRPRDLTLNIGVGDTKEVRIFTELPYAELSTFGDALNTSQKGIKRRVDVAPLDTILEKHAPTRQIDFLKIDAEGWELQILKGLDLRRFRPVVLVVEAVLPESCTPSHDTWEPLIVAKGYSMVYFDGLNRFYLADERSDLAGAFALPPGVFDEITPAKVVHLTHQTQVLADAIRRLTKTCGLPDTLQNSPSADELLKAISAIERQIDRTK